MKTLSCHQAILIFALSTLWAGTPKATLLPKLAWHADLIQHRNFTIRSGLTYDLCSSDSDCKSPRECIDIFGDPCSSPSAECNCIPKSGYQDCTSSSDCVSGEGCVTGIGGTASCASCDVVSNNEGILSFVDDAETCSAVCVSTIHLKHMKSSDLVFSEHRRAFVLCDSHGSCATPGHIVVYKSHAMTMRRYCKMMSEPCRQRVMLVNSPRMQYGLRVDSLTEGLEFTPLAAKYESTLEETVLKLLVHIGM